MISEQIYEIISGKLLQILENQPKNIIDTQEELDNLLAKFKKTLSDEQSNELKNILETYTKYITETNNFHFECGIDIGKKFANALNN